MRLKKKAELDNSVKTELAKEMKRLVINDIKGSDKYSNLSNNEKGEIDNWLNSLSEDYEFTNELNVILNLLNKQLIELAKSHADALIEHQF